VTRAVESDVALVLACLALANRAVSGLPEIGGVRAALAVISPAQLANVVSHTAVFDFFDVSASRALTAQRLALHAASVQRMAGRLAPEREDEQLDELATAALLHDVGKLALPPPGQAVHDRDACTPEERLRAERLELGVDHAAFGGALARSWNLPERLAEAIETHHSDDAEGNAAIVRVADMLTHHRHGNPIDLDMLLRAGQRLGFSRGGLGSILYDVAEPSTAAPAACPLSGREREVLHRLSDGRTYKQIGLDLGISTSTVRGHLHRIYVKLGVVDRAQAVLLASRLGWI
jgi:putative nucleotidyltransferase with HDIG domain